MLRAAFRSFRRIVAPSLRHIELKQSIHVSAVAGAKRYRRAETEFNYKFVNHYEPIESESKQTRNPFLLEEDYSKKTTTELVQAFEDLSFHCHETGTCISNENFDDLLEELTAKVSDLDDEQVMKVLFDLHRFPEAVSSRFPIAIEISLLDFSRTLTLTTFTLSGRRSTKHVAID